MKTFEQIMTSGGYYVYKVYKITDFKGQTYYEAVPITIGCVTRVSDSIEELQNIVDRDAKNITQFNQRIR